MALLGNLTGSSQFFNNDTFYNGVVTTSLRLDKASSAYLYRTPSSGSNRRTFTIAFWYKTSIVFASEAGDQNNPIFYADEPSGGGLFALNVSAQGQGAATDTENEMQYYDYDSADSTDYGLETNRPFSDPSAWYHVVWAFDTTQGTEANRVKVYINGVQHAYTDMNAHHGAVVQNRELNVNQATPHWIGRNIDTTSRYMNGYLADFNFIDGTQYDASYFGEFKNGIWIPKEPSVTYGTNGFRLQFKNTSVGSGSSSTIGADTSGNDNHFTSSGIAANDCAIPDCPENNFATALGSISEPQDYQSYYKATYAEGNLKVTGSSSGWSNGSSNFGMTSGKWYAECRVGAKAGTGYIRFGMRSRPARTYDEYFWNDDGTGQVDAASSPYSDRVGTYGAGDKLMVALDLDNNALYFGKNGTWENSATSSEIANGTTTNAFVQSTTIIPTGTNNIGQAYFFYCQPHSTGSNIIWNFGQDSSFAGAETAQGNTDGNGIGDFYYAPPSGFLALCSANLPEPTIGPNSATQSDDHFDTVLYTGNATDDTAIAVDFQPDWTWIKKRSGTQEHVLFDSSRGATKRLFSNLANAESDEATSLKAFTSSGFTLGTHSSVNDNTETFVAWNWKANGGTTSSNTDGAGTSTVQANTTAGFSIVTYTGSSNETYGHGLDSAPEMILVKGRNIAHNWAVYHQGVQDGTANGFLELNTSSGIQTGSNPRFLNGTTSTSQPTSTVFNVNHYSGSSTNASNQSDTYVAYCFHSVEGYSKFGIYTANESTDGVFIYLGFRPAWAMIKRTAGNGWAIQDSVRSPFNQVNNLLQANETNTEYTTDVKMDFLSNGIKMRNDSGFFNHVSGDTFIYMAFAEAPFKYANAR